MSNKPKLYTVYSKKVAYQLRELGFKIVEMGINKNYPQFDTYLFIDTPEFQMALSNISNKK